MRSTVVRPLGLITEPNTEGQYPPGALSEAFNVMIRDHGILEVMHARTTYSGHGMELNNTYDLRRVFDLRALYSSGEPLMLAFGVTSGGVWGVASYVSEANGPVTINFPELTFTASPGHLHLDKSGGLWFFTGDQGVFMLGPDTELDGLIGSPDATLAGIPAPRTVEFDSTETVGQAVEDGKVRTWRAIFVREKGDRLIQSAPSYPFSYSNGTGTDRNVIIKVSWTEAHYLTEGDKVELYATPTQDTGTDTGATYYLAATVELDSSDLAAYQVDIRDMCPDGALGVELYTNPGQEGNAKAKLPPGKARGVSMHGGHAFYIMQQEAATHTIRIPGKWGNLSGGDPDLTFGVGVRAITGDTTDASATVSDISDFTGLKVGQLIADVPATAIPAGTTIASINEGGGTLTMSATATASLNDATIAVTDQIEINGQLHPMTTAGHMLEHLAHDDDLVLFDFDRAIPIDSSDLDGVEMRIHRPFHFYGNITLRASNGQNYDPPLPELDETVMTVLPDEKLNRMRISEKDQPEAVPAGAGNELFIGGEELYRAIHATDAEYVFASDGLWRVTGVFPEWAVDQIDRQIVIANEDAACRLGEDVYAYTNRGLIRIRPGGLIEHLSRGLVGDSAHLPGQSFETTWNLVLAADEANNEVHLFFAGTPLAWVFNANTNSFVTTDYDEGLAGVSEIYPVLVYIEQESLLLWADGGSGGNPLMRRRDPDNVDAARLPVIEFQPITGDGDPFKLKEWIDCDLDVHNWNQDVLISPTMNGVDQSAFQIDIPGGSVSPGQRSVRGCGISREASLAASMAPGFVFNDRARLYGVSLRWVLVSEEIEVR